MSSRLFLACFVLAAAAVGTYFAVQPSQPEIPAETKLVKPAPEVEPPPPLAVAPLQDAPPPTLTPAAPTEMIRYPDGTYMPPLNGVKNPAGLQWPAEFPYSPIVGKQFSGQVEWYVHADGTQTTTQMVWRSDLGREDAVTHVARPMPAVPVDPGG